MIIDTKKIKKAIFEGTAKEAAEITGIPQRRIEMYRSKETSTSFRDWQGMSLKTAIAIMDNLDDE